MPPSNGVANPGPCFAVRPSGKLRKELPLRIETQFLLFKIAFTKKLPNGSSEAFMNCSIYSADRTTHLKIVVLALIAGIAMSGIAMSSRIGSNTETVAVIKAGKPLAVSSAAATITR